MSTKQETKTGLVKLYARFRALPVPARITAYVASSVFVLALCYLVFILAYWGKIYPHITVGGVSVSGLTQAQAEVKLAQAAINNKPITLVYGDKTNSIATADITWQSNSAASVQAAYEIGRDESFWRSLVRSAASIIKKRDLLPVVSYNSDQLANKLSAVVGPINKPAVNASASFTGSKLTITKETAGQVVDTAALGAAILNSWAHYRTDAIQLVLVPDLPKIVLGDQAALTSAANTLAAKTITLKWPAGQKALTKNDVAAMVDFVGAGDVDATGAQELTAQFSATKVRQFLLSYAAANINEPAKEPKLAVQNGKVVVVSASSVGSVLDLDATTPLVLSALTSATTNPLVTVTMQAQNPLIDQNNIASLGLTTLIGEGTTSFAGSPTDRAANIARGVQLLNGVLLPPGQEFSTLKNLAPIDASNGYVKGLVIKDNRTVPDYGGGLCQVSTTLFRSVLAAGLKVTERQNHLYRVSYYEPPVGLDATIFDPAPDFKFLNDTPGYILVQAFISGTKVTFDLWGTADGRTASVTTPQILSTTPAGDPIYTNTDTLDIGTTKQIEHAHDGMVTTATYTVKRDGKIINQQIFKSIYKPWPAQYLVGTHDPASGPAPTQ